MKYGLFGINFGPCADSDVSSEVAIAAEAAGFESLWTGEHLALPSPQAPPSPVPAEMPFVDPAVARYEDLGVDRLIVQLRPRGEETPLEAVDRIASGVGLTAS